MELAKKLGGGDVPGQKMNKDGVIEVETLIKVEDEEKLK